MDSTELNGVMQEAIDYASEISFLPLHPVDEHFDKVLALWARIGSRDRFALLWKSEQEEITQQAFIMYCQHAALFVLGFSGHDLACAWWVTNISGHEESSRCELSGWFPFSSRGLGSEHILHKVLSYLHETLGIQSVFMRSPWRTVQSLCERAGLTTVAEIERYYIRGKPETVRVFRSERQ